MTFPTADPETILLREIWQALGCAPNPDDFKPSVRERMRDQALTMIRESTTHESRIYRENQQLREALQACGSASND